jgi:hypothetical protein
MKPGTTEIVKATAPVVKDHGRKITQRLGRFAKAGRICQSGGVTPPRP